MRGLLCEIEGDIFNHFSSGFCGRAEYFLVHFLIPGFCMIHGKHIDVGIGAGRLLLAPFVIIWEE